MLSPIENDMCGIIGYLGKKEAAPILVEGLRRLQYRGYDSAGMAVLNDGSLEIRKRKGKMTRAWLRLLREMPAPGCAWHRPYPVGDTWAAVR